MPLTPQDQAYWKERLGWKAAVFLVVSTVVMGCVVAPLAMFFLSWSSGHASDWTWASAFDFATANFWLALLVSTIMWFVGQLYRWMDWLPPRRR